MYLNRFSILANVILYLKVHVVIMALWTIEVKIKWLYIYMIYHMNENGYKHASKTRHTKFWKKSEIKNTQKTHSILATDWKYSFLYFKNKWQV